MLKTWEFNLHCLTCRLNFFSDNDAEYFKVTNEYRRPIRFLAISHHYSRALCRTVYDFPWWPGIWAPAVVLVGRPERGFHIGYRRRDGGAYISSEHGFSKIDERAGSPPREN